MNLYRKLDNKREYLSANETMEIIEDAIKTENEFMKFVNELSIAPDEGDHIPSTVRNLFIIICA